MEGKFYYLDPDSTDNTINLMTKGETLNNFNVRGEKITVHDARTLSIDFDKQGFCMIPFGAKLKSDLDPEADAGVITTQYYRQCEEVLKKLLGASKVKAFDHNVRNFTQAEQNKTKFNKPVHLVHNDFTEESAPRRFRKIFNLNPEEKIQGRYAFINLWKPIVGPVLQSHLAICDASSIAPQDLKLIELQFPDRTGHIYSAQYNPYHKWYYFPELTSNEALLLKCFDSDEKHACFSLHSAFRDRAMPENTPDRFSIEVRTIVQFA